MLRFFISAIFIALCSYSISEAQPVVLLKGKVTSAGTAQKVDIQFKDETGNSVRASSASDGSYQTVLKPGHSYAVVITDDNLARYKFSYEVPRYEKYTELNHDFSIGTPEVTTTAKPIAGKTKKKTKTKKTTKGKQK